MIPSQTHSMTTHQRFILKKKQQDLEIYDKLQHLSFLFFNLIEINKFILFIDDLKKNKTIFIFYNDYQCDWQLNDKAFLDSVGIQTYFLNKLPSKSLLEKKKDKIIYLVSNFCSLSKPVDVIVFDSSIYFQNEIPNLFLFWKEYSLFYNNYKKLTFKFDFDLLNLESNFDIKYIEHLHLVRYLNTNNNTLNYAFALHYQDDEFCLYLSNQKPLIKSIKMLKFLKKSSNKVRQEIEYNGFIYYHIKGKNPWFMYRLETPHPRRKYDHSNRPTMIFYYKENIEIVVESHYPKRIPDIRDLDSQINDILISSDLYIPLEQTTFISFFNQSYFCINYNNPNIIYIASLLYNGRIIFVVFNSSSQFEFNYGKYFLILYSIDFPNYYKTFEYSVLASLNLQFINFFESTFSSDFTFPITLSTNQYYIFFDGRNDLTIQLTNNIIFKQSYNTGLFKFHDHFYNLYLLSYQNKIDQLHKLKSLLSFQTILEPIIPSKNPSQIQLKDKTKLSFDDNIKIPSSA
jgi:hypothetical protein